MTASPYTVVVDVPPEAFDRTVAFWAAALDAEAVWPDELDDFPYVWLDDARSVLQVLVQRLGAGEPPRCHLDLVTGDVDAEAARLEAAGARRRDRGWVRDREWWVLHDPAGNPLCVVPEGRGSTLAARRRDRGYLDGVFVDVPAADADACIAFWSAALDATPERGEPYTSLLGVRGPGGALTAAVQRVDAPARVHVDLRTDDVEAEADRLVALGAGRVHQVEDWWTLADPAGNPFCVVPP